MSWIEDRIDDAHGDFLHDDNSEPRWVTGEPIVTMSDEHLVNSIRMVRQKRGDGDPKWHRPGVPDMLSEMVSEAEARGLGVAGREG